MPMSVHSKLSPADKSNNDVSNGKEEDFLKTLEKVFNLFTDSVGRQSPYIAQGILHNLSTLPFTFLDRDNGLKSKLMSGCFHKGKFQGHG